VGLKPRQGRQFSSQVRERLESGDGGKVKKWKSEKGESGKADRSPGGAAVQ